MTYLHEKNKNKRKQEVKQILGSCQRIGNSVEAVGDGITNFCSSLWKGPKALEKRFGDLKIRVRIKTIQTPAVLKACSPGVLNWLSLPLITVKKY